MRHVTNLVLVCLLLLVCGGQSRLPDGNCGRCANCTRTGQLCRDNEVGSLEPVSIEDQAYERGLQHQAAQLIKDDDTVDMRTLRRQLDRDLCQLDLPQAQVAPCSATELFQSASDAVVVVAGVYKCNRCTRWHTTTASGFAITQSGAIVTNYHVVDDDDVETMVVMTADRRVYPVKEVLAANAAEDLAILKIDADNLRPLPFADSFAAAPVGTSVGVVSHPDGRFYCYTSGVVSRYMKIRSKGRDVDVVTITADYARGSSGAPVLNHVGQVVAVVMSTESVYYTETADRQLNLQMVFKTCVPTRSLRRMIQPKALLDTAAAIR